MFVVNPSFSGKRARLDPKKKCKNSRLILLDVDKDQGLTIRDNRGGGEVLISVKIFNTNLFSAGLLEIKNTHKDYDIELGRVRTKQRDCSPPPSKIAPLSVNYESILEGRGAPL